MTRKKRGVDGEGDFFGFGKSLTVKGELSILPATRLEEVADSRHFYQRVSSLSPMNSSKTTVRNSSR